VENEECIGKFGHEDLCCPSLHSIELTKITTNIKNIMDKDTIKIGVWLLKSERFWLFIKLKHISTVFKRIIWFCFLFKMHLLLARRNIGLFKLEPSTGSLFRAGQKLRQAQGRGRSGNEDGPLHDLSDFHFAGKFYFNLYFSLWIK
jgi:hypothetical protein